MKRTLFSTDVRGLVAAVALLASGCGDDKPAQNPGGEPGKDYAALSLNEVNCTGAEGDRYVELYNKSDAEVVLDGVTVTCGGVKVSFEADVKISGGGYAVLQSAELGGALLPDKQIRVELSDPKGGSLDTFRRGDGAGGPVLGDTDKSYSRIPDGTGEWYMTAAAGSKGATNGTATEGLTLVSDADIPGQQEMDYTELSLNEVNCTGAEGDRYVELYNKSDAEVVLDGVTVTCGGVKVSFEADVKISGGGYAVLQSAKLGGALLPDKQIRVELSDPKGGSLDTFRRGDGAGGPVLGDTDKSYSRIPDGTGEWYMTAAAGSKGATNGTATEGLTLVSDADTFEVPDDAVQLVYCAADYLGEVYAEGVGEYFIALFDTATNPFEEARIALSLDFHSALAADPTDAMPHMTLYKPDYDNQFLLDTFMVEDLEAGVDGTYWYLDFANGGDYLAATGGWFSITETAGEYTIQGIFKNSSGKDFAFKYVGSLFFNDQTQAPALGPQARMKR